MLSPCHEDCFIYMAVGTSFRRIAPSRTLSHASPPSATSDPAENNTSISAAQTINYVETPYLPQSGLCAQVSYHTTTRARAFNRFL